ncbi:MAG: hypothetical protein HY735_00020 [Verrucomicrobia bacterium]|nr:hypothetical protein [Verrucomicrobiota bacterium]
MDMWKLVLDEAAFQFLLSLPSGDRRRLLGAFEALRSNPHRQPDYFAKDSTGRTLSVWAARPFLITYWLDSFVSELRVVNIERVKF